MRFHNMFSTVQVTDLTIPQKVQTVKSWLDEANSSVIDAKLADHIVIWAQTYLRNVVRKNLEAPEKHFQCYCECFILFTYMTATLEL